MGRSFIKDFSWYFVGSLVPIMVGLVNTPVFTRHFDEMDYGYLGIVAVTFSFLGMLLFSWISSCIWRYYPRYKETGNLKTLYSNLSFLFLMATLLLIVVSGIWYLTALHKLVRELIVYALLHLIISQCYLFYMVALRLEARVKFYTVLQSLRAFLGLVVTLILVFVFGANITALISALLLIDLLVLLFLWIRNPLGISVHVHLIQQKHLKELLVYGSAGLLLNVCFLIISSSDRYVIAWLGDVAEVGVYDQVYKLSQLSVTALVAVFLNTISPTLIHRLESRYTESASLIRSYLKAMVLVGFPIVFYLGFFSKDIADLLLGEDFRSGYPIMPFVFVSAYFHGISNLYELRLKFADKLRKLGLIVLLGTGLNILLTIVFVWYYGYIWAAVTTTVTYLFLMMSFHFFDREVIGFSTLNRPFLLLLLCLILLQLGLYLLLDLWMVFTLLNKIVLIGLFILMYLLVCKDKIRKIHLPLTH